MATSRRGAFSLLELLVVLGILMTFLGLTLGAVLRTPTVNAAVATAHVMSDLVRQGGHAARTSGTPVVIEIYQNSPDVLGVSQVPIQREAFENVQPGSSAPDALSASASDPCGFTGRGLRIADLSPGASGTADLLTTTDRQQQLYRISTNGAIEGFYLACAVRPPVPTALGSGLYPQNLVLVVVNGDASATSAATCGLQLTTSEYAVQPAPPIPNPVPANLPPPPAPVAFTYNLNGWVSTDQGIATVQTQNTPFNAAATSDVAGPLAGGMWMQVGLMFDGTNLELYLDDRLVATTVLANLPKTLVPGSVPGQVAVGAYVSVPATDTDPATKEPMSSEIAVVPGSDDGTFEPTRRWRESTGTIDEVRLDRLGVNRAARLPNGASANADYRITFHPDGEVETSAPGGTLSFTTPGQGAVTVTVAVDGAVTTTVIPP